MTDQPISAHGPIVEAGGATAAAAHGHGAHDPHAHHSGGNGKYIAVFVALCFLTTLSFCTYFNWWHKMFTVGESRMLMMAVSCTKALLVILCFMHIWWEANWKYVLTIPAAMMSMFLMLMLVPDIGNRLRRASDEKQFYQAEPKPEHGAHAKQPVAAEHAP
ncbi:MAG TPA: cytochrome C oxidase subunit IV family protein [Pirellulales bacterium]|jgi:cytochrome c oxidase subunit 4